MGCTASFSSWPRVPGRENLPEIGALIAPHSLRPTRDQVPMDLPDRVDNNFFVEMTPRQWGAYDEFKELLARLLAKSRRRPLIPKEREILLNCLVKMPIIGNALALDGREIPPRNGRRRPPRSASWPGSWRNRWATKATRPSHSASGSARSS